MALSQIQIIRSLDDALTWLEKEIEWGVNIAELRHLTGRIGELYVAMKTLGKMAPEVNQKGYDVISRDEERISVKTITSAKHIRFNKNTFDLADRVIILRLNLDDDSEISIEEILDKPVKDFFDLCRSDNNGKKYIYSPSRKKTPIPLEQQKIVKQAHYKTYIISEYENGSIHIEKDGVIQHNINKILKKLALSLGVDIVTSGGRPRGNRRLGAQIIAAIETIHQRK